MNIDKVLKDELIASLQSASKDQIAYFIEKIWKNESVKFEIIKETMTINLGEKKVRKPTDSLPEHIGGLLVKDSQPRIGRPPKPQETPQNRERRHKPVDDLPDLVNLSDEDLAKLAEEVGVENPN